MESDEYISGIKGLFLLIILCCVFYVITLFSIERINGWSQKNEHLSVVSGVRRGLKAYSKQYDLSKDGLSNIAEGYLLQEDLTDFSKTSNPLKIDSKQGLSLFKRYLASYSRRSEEEVSSWKMYIVTIYTTFANTGVVGTNSIPIISSTYNFKIEDVNGNVIQDSTIISDPDLLSEYIGAALDVKLDITGDSLNPSVPTQHMAQAYYRENPTSKSVSTYTTFMAVGVNIPIVSKFGPQSNISFYELQTFSSER